MINSENIFLQQTVTFHTVKVIVDKLGVDRIRQENLFEFNLQKSGIETELVPPDSSDR